MQDEWPKLCQTATDSELARWVYDQKVAALGQEAGQNEMVSAGCNFAQCCFPKTEAKRDVAYVFLVRQKGTARWAVLARSWAVWERGQWRRRCCWTVAKR